MLWRRLRIPERVGFGDVDEQPPSEVFHLDVTVRRWSETCTLWAEGERFEFDVHTDGYPYPLAAMRGAWWVRAEHSDVSRVGMDFRYQPRSGMRGAVFAATMQAAFPLVLRRILRGWRAEMTRRSVTARAACSRADVG